jgi:hypothetical protein
LVGLAEQSTDYFIAAKLEVRGDIAEDSGQGADFKGVVIGYRY